jgi:hypothetical protein
VTTEGTVMRAHHAIAVLSVVCLFSLLTLTLSAVVLIIRFARNNRDHVLATVIERQTIRRMKASHDI